MKILIACDSYKNCLSSTKIASVLKKTFNTLHPDWEIKTLSLADGGEGTVEALYYNLNSAELHKIDLPGPFGKIHEAHYIISDNGTTACIELANVCGIEIENRKDSMTASTYGLGLLLKHVTSMEKIRKIVIGIGGSASTDGGAGMLQGMGGRFFDADNNEIFEAIGGGDLKKICRCDMEIPLRLVKNKELVICSDVRNPLIGENGAAYIFAPQKGASPEQVYELDKNLKYFFEILKEQGYCRVCDNPGDGAAGGTGFALQEILGGKVCSGGEYLLKLANFTEYAAQANILITGEGKSDAQTLQGKLPYQAAKIAKQFKQCKVILLSGAITDAEVLLDSNYFDAVFSIASGPVSLEQAIAETEKNLQIYARNIAALFSKGADL